jgi:hypothetical protein
MIDGATLPERNILVRIEKRDAAENQAASHHLNRRTSEYLGACESMKWILIHLSSVNTSPCRVTGFTEVYSTSQG